MSLWHPTKPAYPIADLIQTLGSPTLRWLEIYSQLPANFYNLGGTILRRDDTVAITTSTTYVKVKEFYVPKLIPKTSKLRIYFELRSGVAGASAYARIYRNGSPYGTERINNTTTYAPYTEDLEFSEGDYIQIYAKCDEEGSTSVRNFRIQGSLANQLFDAFGRIQSRVDEYAGFLLGDAAGNLDVNLYRSAADVLKTDDNLDALALRIGGTEVITSGRVLKNIASVAQTLLPDADNTYALGSSSYRWSDVRTALLNGWNPDSHASRHADGGSDEITSKLDYRAMNIPQAKAFNTTAFSTTSTSYVDITGLSVSITLLAPSNALVFSRVNLLYDDTANTSIYERLLRDATDVVYLCLGYAGAANERYNSLIQTLQTNLAAGSYTFKLQGCVSGGTGYWGMSSGGFAGEITVIGFPY
jgi:hypothetical protein